MLLSVKKLPQDSGNIKKTLMQAGKFLDEV